MANNMTLETVAAQGNIEQLYQLIQRDPQILEVQDAIPFADTSLHIAASNGNVHLAIEIIKLKPSFALKLNNQGWSPIHLALQNNHNYLVCCLASIDKDLVRFKGRERLTLLHLLCQHEANDANIDLLIDLLDSCPDSIKDVNVRGETALHIAVGRQNFRALQVLVCWLKKNDRKDATNLEYLVLNKKDETGNTILHTLARAGQAEVIALLIKKRLTMNTNVKNMENNTALDLAQGFPDVERILLDVGARRGDQLVPHPSLEDEIINPTFSRKMKRYIMRCANDISLDEGNVYMVFAVFIVSAIYQSALSPPGGLYPADNGANNLNNTSSLNLTANVAPGNAGKSALPGGEFLVIMMCNTLAFSLALELIGFIMLSRTFRSAVVAPIMFVFWSYFFSVTSISPPSAIVAAPLSLLIVVLFHLFIFLFLHFSDFFKRRDN